LGELDARCELKEKDELRERREPAREEDAPEAREIIRTIRG
jgi:hypothetical protein